MNPTPPENTRAFFDPEVLRKKVLETAKEAYEKKINSMESNGFTLKAENLHYPDQDKNYSVEEQKQAILEKRDIGLPLKAKITMINKKDGTVIDSKETILARVPWLTERNTAIMNGTEYTPINQSRLKSGVYCRRAKSGLLEGHVNVESGSGVGGKVVFSPQTQQFFYKIQNSQFHLYSLLRDMGTSDSDLEKDWGLDLLNRNRKNYDPNVVDKLHNKLFVRF